jgi:hypothetical protein
VDPGLLLAQCGKVAHFIPLQRGQQPRQSERTGLAFGSEPCSEQRFFQQGKLASHGFLLILSGCFQFRYF